MLYINSNRPILFLSTLLAALILSTIYSERMAYAGDKVVVIPLGGDESATSKLVFVTNGSWQGDLGGVSGADVKCVVEAKSRSIKGEFQAFLGTPSATPVTRANHYSLKYRRLDGDTLRSSYHSLFNGLDNPIATSGIAAVWTGLGTDGRPNGMNNCQDWTSRSGADFGRVGNGTQTNSDWISAADNNCSNLRKLYCIEQ